MQVVTECTFSELQVEVPSIKEADGVDAHSVSDLMRQGGMGESLKVPVSVQGLRTTSTNLQGEKINV